MRDIEAVWRRIRQFQGETFRQIRGAQFTYTLSAASLQPDRTNQSIPKGLLLVFARNVTVARLPAPPRWTAVASSQ